MSIRRTSLVVLTAMGLALVALRALDAEPGDSPAATDANAWPQWRGPNGDNICAETGLADTWPEGGPGILWSQPVGQGYTTPVAVNGVVYLFHLDAKSDTLSAFDAEKGTPLWSASYMRGYAGQYPGTRATPTIDGDRAYTYGGSGELACWTLKSGQVAERVLWRRNVVQESGGRNLQWGVSSSPLVWNGLVVVQAGGGGAAVVACDKSTGEVKWKSAPNADGSYAPVVAIDVDGMTQLVAFGGKSIMGIDPARNGRIIWTVPWSNRGDYDVHAATPLYRNKQLFLTSGYGIGCTMLKVSKTGATQEWKHSTPHCKFPSPILDGDVFYANSEGELMCFDWPSGKTRWSAQDERRLRIGPGGSFLRFNRDKMVVLSERGELLLIRADKDGFKIMSSLQMPRGSDWWASPVIYNKRLYLKGPNKLFCLDMGKP
ncbi:MAG: Outer membrane protein assembly factor BamB [Phycisphaerae bacterium]|nr:Outer membrane protein assembly factor BamB [Phycisphaerae bacterium]